MKRRSFLAMLGLAPLAPIAAAAAPKDEGVQLGSRVWLNTDALFKLSKAPRTIRLKSFDGRLVIEPGRITIAK